MFKAVYEAKGPLAAYWYYAGIPAHFGVVAVNPKFGRFATAGVGRFGRKGLP